MFLLDSTALDYNSNWHLLRTQCVPDPVLSRLHATSNFNLHNKFRGTY